MTYSQVVTEARFKVGEVAEGTVIQMWQRTVDDTGVATFQAMCGPDDGSGKCILCWKNGANDDGQLVLTYYCDDLNCLTAKKKSRGVGSQDSSCVLQYSYDGRTFFEVTPDKPPATQQCFFRCQCCVQVKAPAKPRARKTSKTPGRKPVKKAARKQKSKSKAKGKKR